MKKLAQDIQHYMPLIGILTFGAYGILTFAYNPAFQFVIALAIAAAYVTWGMVHHYIHKDLHIEVAVEYIVVAVLGVMIIFSLIF